MGLLVAYLGLCLLGCLAFSPSVEGVRSRSLLRPRSPCPPGALYFRSVCYEFLEDSVKWQEAEDSCQYWRDGHLASIRSKTEENVISDYIKSTGSTNTVWIGFHATVVSSKLNWRWSDGFSYIRGSPLWDNRRPSTSSSSNHCMVLYNVQYKTSSPRWLQVSCSAAYPYLCKYPAAY